MMTPIKSDSEEEPDDIDDLDGNEVVFDIQHLLYAYGTKTTEIISWDCSSAEYSWS